LFENNALACPDWTTAYYTVQQGADDLVPEQQRRQEWSDAHEARAPKSEETAEKLVQNLGKAPKAVQDAVWHGLRQQREGQYQPPAERKARDAHAREVVEPIVAEATEGFNKIALVGTLHEARDELQELTAERLLTLRLMKRVDLAFAELEQEMQVARGVVGLEVQP
jgi:hypothetical protein